MASAAAFAEVLDSYVHRGAPAGAAAAGRCHPSIATRGLYWFEGAVSMSRPAASARQASRAPHLRLVNPAPRRPARTLSPSQLEALRQLQALGATLDTTFTRDELRAAFRALALAYHPDRHPATTATERVRLSGTFMTVRRAYDELKTAA